jgi:hypothetical protein
LWLSRGIQEPDKMITERDPTALAMLAKYNNLTMPNLGLGDVEAGAILQYIDDETKRLAGVTPPSGTVRPDQKNASHKGAAQRTASK